MAPNFKFSGGIRSRYNLPSQTICLLYLFISFRTSYSYLNQLPCAALQLFKVTIRILMSFLYSSLYNMWTVTVEAIQRFDNNCSRNMFITCPHAMTKFKSILSHQRARLRILVSTSWASRAINYGKKNKTWKAPWVKSYIRRLREAGRGKM